MSDKNPIAHEEKESPDKEEKNVEAVSEKTKKESCDSESTEVSKEETVDGEFSSGYKATLPKVFKFVVEKMEEDSDKNKQGNAKKRTSSAADQPRSLQNIEQESCQPEATEVAKEETVGFDVSSGNKATLPKVFKFGIDDIKENSKKNLRNVQKQTSSAADQPRFLKRPTWLSLVEREEVISGNQAEDPLALENPRKRKSQDPFTVLAELLQEDYDKNPPKPKAAQATRVVTVTPTVRSFGDNFPKSKINFNFQGNDFGKSAEDFALPTFPSKNIGKKSSFGFGKETAPIFPSARSLMDLTEEEQLWIATCNSLMSQERPPAATRAAETEAPNVPAFSLATSTETEEVTFAELELTSSEEEPEEEDDPNDFPGYTWDLKTKKIVPVEENWTDIKKMPWAQNLIRQGCSVKEIISMRKEKLAAILALPPPEPKKKAPNMRRRGIEFRKVVDPPNRVARIAVTSYPSADPRINQLVESHILDVSQLKEEYEENVRRLVDKIRRRDATISKLKEDNAPSLLDVLKKEREERYKAEAMLKEEKKKATEAQWTASHFETKMQLIREMMDQPMEEMDAEQEDGHA